MFPPAMTYQSLLTIKKYVSSSTTIISQKQNKAIKSNGPGAESNILIERQPDLYFRPTAFAKICLALRL